MSVRFSIITVTFNACRTLGATLESVENQWYDCVEHIVVDGASTDGTVALARAYAERQESRGKSRCVRVVSEPDEGLYDAMNKGLSMATGDYVVFLNAGDRLHGTDVLACVADVVEGCGGWPGVVYGETDLTDAEGRFVRRRRLQVPRRLTWRSFRGGMSVCHQSFYVRRGLAQGYGYDLRYRFSADFDWCVRVLRGAEREGLVCVNANRVLTDYLCEGMTTRNHRASLKERFVIMADHYGLGTTVLCHGWFVLRMLWKR